MKVELAAGSILDFCVALSHHGKIRTSLGIHNSLKRLDMSGRFSNSGYIMDNEAPTRRRLGGHLQNAIFSKSRQLATS